jgi:hypothetical protein
VGRYWLIGLTLCVATRAFASDDYAADELQRYLQRVTATPVPAVEVKTDATLGPGEAFSITAGPDQIKITGSNTYMTLAAVYRFLDFQGCRFLAPAFDSYRGSSEVVPTNRMLQAVKMWGKPQLKFRKFYVEEGHSHDAANLKQLAEWMPKAGYNTLVIPTDYQGSGRVKWDNWRAEIRPELQKRGIIIEVGGHGYQNFLNAEMDDGKLFEQHADWFGKDAKGQPQRAKGRVFCTSNADAASSLINNFTSYIKDRPEIQIYDFWPPDGAKWCECEKCTALGTPSDRQAILVAQVKEAAKKVRPDLRLEVLAYHTSVAPPQKLKLDPEILLDFCPISQQFDVQINDPSSPKNKEYVDGVTAWRKAFDGDISIYTYYRKYAWDSLPVIIPHYMQKDMQWYATLPVQGVSVYSEPGDWFTYELNHYVLGQLAWDVNADVDALITKFCDARYGTEAKAAREALVALEEITRVHCSVPHVPLKEASTIEKARKDAQTTAATVAEAQQRATDENVKYNLGRLALMYKYAIDDMEIQQMRASNAPLEEMRAKATALHSWAKGHADEGVFLIKNHRLNQARMLTRLGIGEKKK